MTMFQSLVQNSLQNPYEIGREFLENIAQIQDQ